MLFNLGTFICIAFVEIRFTFPRADVHALHVCPACSRLTKSQKSKSTMHLNPHSHFNISVKNETKNGKIIIKVISLYDSSAFVYIS